MTIIEQPEVHLHPKAEAELAELFIDIANKKKRFLIETHSDYFVERIRMGIMRGKEERMGIIRGEEEEKEYLFSWDNVPGNDSKRLLRYLKDDHDIGWAEKAEISKSDDKTIHIFKDENLSATITLVEDEGKATLKISNGRTLDLKVKKEDDKLNIYEKEKKKGISHEDVAIYYVEQDEKKKCSIVTKIEINEMGQYSTSNLIGGNLPDGYLTNIRLQEMDEITKKLLETL